MTNTVSLGLHINVIGSPILGFPFHYMNNDFSMKKINNPEKRQIHPSPIESFHGKRSNWSRAGMQDFVK